MTVEMIGSPEDGQGSSLSFKGCNMLKSRGKLVMILIKQIQMGAQESGLLKLNLFELEKTLSPNVYIELKCLSFAFFC